MRKNRFLWQLLVILVLLLGQSLLVQRLTGHQVIPQIAFIALIFSAYSQVSFWALFLGFASGIAHDLMSTAPIGFFSFLYTGIAYLFSRFKGKIFIDPVLVPILMTLGATLLRQAGALLLTGLFSLPARGPLFSGGFGLELLFNAMAAPLVLALLKTTDLCRTDIQDSF